MANHECISRGEKLIIPFASMIEIGNHIAQIKNNDSERRRCASEFAEFLDKSRNNKAPWILCIDGLTEEQIGFISEKFGDIGADMQIGTGDISIVYQYKMFRERVSGTAEGVEIWSLDHHISSLLEAMRLIRGIPDAEILSFDHGVIHPVSYEETDSYQETELFINNREQILRRLLDTDR